MKGLVLSIGAVVAALSLTYGLGIASASSSSSASTATKVGTASSKLGRILVDRHGRTLYLFAKDRHGKSACSGAVRGLLAPADRVGQAARGQRGEGVLLGTTRRATAACRSPTAHHPLYRFSGDTGKGQTTGQGLDGLRRRSGGCVSPAGNKIVTAAPPARATRPEARSSVASNGAV